MNKNKEFLTAKDVRLAVKKLEKKAIKFDFMSLIKCPKCKCYQVIYIKDDMIITKYAVENLHPITSLRNYLKKSSQR